MSLTTPTFIAPLVVFSLGALTIASCGEQSAPTSPSALTAPAGLQPAVAEYFVTLLATGTPPIRTRHGSTG